MKPLKIPESLDFVDLTLLLNQFVDWAISTYSYDGHTKAHHAVARVLYLKDLKKSQRSITLGLLWDLALWIHDNNYFDHPKNTFFALIQQLKTIVVDETECGPYLVFDEMVQEGSATTYIDQAKEIIGVWPVLRSYCLTFLTESAIVEEDDEYGDSDQDPTAEALRGM
jgi:hypothetical protein